MAIKRCLKCGANIPDGADFCPSCGAPRGAKAVAQQPPAQQPPAQPQQPAFQQQPVQSQQPIYQQQPMYQKPVKSGDPLKNLVKTLFSTKMMVVFIMIGLLLVFVGMFIWTLGFPGYKTDFQSVADQKDYIESYGILRYASLVSSLGFFIVSGVLLLGGMLNNTLNHYVRLGLILAGAWILAAALNGPALDPGNFLPWGTF